MCSFVTWQLERKKNKQNKSCAVFTWQDYREGKKTNKHKIKVVEWCSGRRARRRWPLTGWPPFGPAECKCLFGHLRDAHSTSSLVKPPSHILFFFFFFYSLRFVKDQNNKIVLETKLWKNFNNKNNFLFPFFFLCVTDLFSVTRRGRMKTGFLSFV